MNQSYQTLHIKVSSPQLMAKLLAEIFDTSLSINEQHFLVDLPMASLALHPHNKENTGGGVQRSANASGVVIEFHWTRWQQDLYQDQLSVDQLQQKMDFILYSRREDFEENFVRIIKQNDGAFLLAFDKDLIFRFF